jgi:phytol kinase
MTALLSIAALTAGFFALFLAGEWLYRRRGVRAEYTRKLAHVGSGLLALTFPSAVGHPGWVAALCAGFLLLLYATRRLGWLPSIHAVPRHSQGAVFFPVAVALCYAVAWSRHDLAFFYLPVACLTVSDTLACLVGRRWSIGRYTFGWGYKSLAGSLAFFASALGLALVFPPSSAAEAPLAVAVAATAGEAIAGRGWDNLTVPLATAGALAML